MKIDSTLNQPILYSKGRWEKSDHNAPEEMEVALFVNGEEWLTFMCSPFQIKQLAVGFLFNEGFISSGDEIELVHLCDKKNNVDVWLTHSVEKPTSWKRSSACNGSETLSSVHIPAPIVTKQIRSPETILYTITRLFESQSHYQQTRGIHCSILTDGDETNIIAEDIGRHNTIDKLAGYLLLNQYDFKQKILATTGRISAEMMAKSINLGVEIVISRTSPTQSSIKTAVQNGITLIGYARRNQFTIYSHPERLMTD